MRRMNKPSQNKAESFILGYPTAYKGTPRARYVYSIKHKNAVLSLLLIFIVLKGFFGSLKPKETLYLSCFMRSALFLQPLCSVLIVAVLIISHNQ